jgi:hypothetical protein
MGFACVDVIITAPWVSLRVTNTAWLAPGQQGFRSYKSRSPGPKLTNLPLLITPTRLLAEKRATPLEQVSTGFYNQEGYQDGGLHRRAPVQGPIEMELLRPLVIRMDEQVSAKPRRALDWGLWECLHTSLFPSAGGSSGSRW